MMLCFAGDLFAAKNPAQAVAELMTDPQVIQELQQVVGTVGLNCATPDRWAQAYAEFKSIMSGIGTTLTEELQTLAYKKDYPSVCHVLTKSQIASYHDWTYRYPDKTDCSLGVCVKYKFERPLPAYYWPKYFIEVTQKGNDSHPSFAENNLLYTSNRKIAYQLGKLFDTKGAANLANKLLGFSLLTDNLKGIGINTKGFDQGRLMQASLMEPLEKLRMRANSHKTLPTYEANIWPVGLSWAVGSNLTVCAQEYQNKNREIGYSWPFKGVPQTCPVAMSKDAYAFWDSGMIDYMDPQAVASMAVASNTVACLSAQLGQSELANMKEGKSSSKGDGASVDKAVSGLTSTLSKAIRPCSWPITGAAEAIAQKVISSADSAKFAGPYCTVWGSLAPRSSTSVYQNDFSMVNSALKFKLMAHELFGIPRGYMERWSLAYPWEGPGSKPFSGSSLVPGLNLDSISKLIKLDPGPTYQPGDESDPLGETMSQMGINTTLFESRSEALFEAGEARLIDTSLYDIQDKIVNIAKEVTYLGALTAAGTASGEAAKSAYESAIGGKAPDPNSILTDLGKTTSDAEDATAHVDDEPIYQFIEYCHVASEKKGTIYGNAAATFPVDYPGRMQGGPFPFAPGSVDLCFNFDLGDCIKKDDFGKCKNKRTGQQVFYKKAEIVGYQKVQNPRFFKVRNQCSVSSFSTPNTEGDKAYCEDIVEVAGTKDTRDKVDRPNPSDAKTIVDRDDTAAQIQAAATAAAFVGIEASRMKYADITGKNHLPGSRRIYTIWEKIVCTYPAQKTTVEVGGVQTTTYDSCTNAVRYELYKYIQTKLIRRICDAMGEEVGKPWK
jgi:hypothetical protein